jgi:hypothetical protein
MRKYHRMPTVVILLKPRLMGMRLCVVPFDLYCSDAAAGKTKCDGHYVHLLMCTWLHHREPRNTVRNVRYKASASMSAFDGRRGKNVGACRRKAEDAGGCIPLDSKRLIDGGIGKPTVEQKMTDLNPACQGRGHHLDKDIGCLMVVHRFDSLIKRNPPAGYNLTGGLTLTTFLIRQATGSSLCRV